MATLVIPAAGLSTRYGLERPKFLIQHPSGSLMITAGLEGLAGIEFDRVLVVSLSRFFEDLDVNLVSNEIELSLGSSVEFLLLDEPTKSMVETISLGIEHLGIDTAIVVKDVDNFIEFKEGPVPSGNFLVYEDLASNPLIIAANKSFIEFDAFKNVSNIVEKRIISNYINTGLVGFAASSDFLRAARFLASTSETYVSDVLRYLMSSGSTFTAHQAGSYSDWGTLSDWRSYNRAFATYLVDLDEALLGESHKYSKTSGWSRIALQTDNAEALLSKSNGGKCRIVFLSSRPAEFKDEIVKTLENFGFRGFDLVLSLPRSQKILIDTFSAFRPYPSAIAINLEKKPGNLSAYLD